MSGSGRSSKDIFCLYNPTFYFDYSSSLVTLLLIVYYAMVLTIHSCQNHIHFFYIMYLYNVLISI